MKRAILGITPLNREATQRLVVADALMYMGDECGLVGIYCVNGIDPMWKSKEAEDIYLYALLYNTYTANTFALARIFE